MKRMSRNGRIGRYKHSPPDGENRIEIQELCKRHGYSRTALRDYTRKGLAVRNGKPKTKGVRLPRVVLEHDRKAGGFVFTTAEAWERFLAKVNPE